MRRWTRFQVLGATTVMLVAISWAVPAGASPSGGALPLMVVLEVPVVGVAGIPLDASAVALNVPVASPAADGYLTVLPREADEPDSSNLNYRAGVDVPNAVIARVGADGTVCISTFAVTDAIVDISGYRLVELGEQYGSRGARVRVIKVS